MIISLLRIVRWIILSNIGLLIHITCYNFSLLLCLYIQNGLNLFLFVVRLYVAGEKKNNILLFASITFYDRLVI
ncbi:hypothetical protein DW986_00340 [Parabacteroides merdae]|uniref:Uncharacterized protein n=1 Tax=Parabacteroides merdae TaxID=46503 RepID=A0A3R6EF03_9BACT|nr:hypothetical protein DW986_00340 [Parabacteroides merdae]RHH80025.1 hypothetical protein DW191_02560 [Parabacteroides merdae]